MKKIIVALIFVMSLASFSWAYTGDGSEDDPYVISSYSDFRALRSELNSGSEKYYKLSCDLQLTSLTELIAPIYTGYGTFTEYRIVYADGVSVDVVSYDVVSIDTMGTPFKGHFDGQGHNIYVKVRPVFFEAGDFTYYMDTSLFGAIETDSGYAVKDLHVGGTVRGFLGGGITSNLYSGTIQNCTVSCDITTETITGEEELELHKIHAGGIAANMYGGRILSCDFSGNISTVGEEFYSYAGGIVGAMAYGKIQGCNVKHYATISASGNDDSERSKAAGGIVGYLEIEDLDSNSDDVTVTGCVFEGGAISSDYSAGGIAGIAYGGIISDNTVGNDTLIIGQTYAGGIAGKLAAGALASENIIEGGVVQAVSGASGGIIGVLELGYVESNDSMASIQGDYAGGVVGQIQNYYGSSGNVTGNSYAGSEFGIGIDENMQVNQDIAGNTKQSATLSFITPSRLSSVKEGENYSASIQLSAPAIIDISPIPSWLHPVQAGSIISMSCIPQTAGTFSFTLNATYGEQSASRTYTLTVDSKLSIKSTRDFPEFAQLGEFYEYTFSATAGGEDVSSLVWSVSGDLPDGLILNPVSGKLSGNPTTEGDYTFEILANVDNMSQASTGTLSLTVSQGLSIIADDAVSSDNAGVINLPTAMIDEDFRFALHTDPSGLDAQWYVVAGNFPSGLTLDEISGLIYGNPDVAGTYYFVVGVNAGTMSATQEMRLTILPSLEISTSSLPSIRVDAPYSATISTNATYETSISWDITGLPEGLSYNTSGLICTISGTVSETGRFPVTVQASYGDYSASRTFTLMAVRGFTILTDELPIGKTGYGYSFRLVTNAASTDAVAWSIIGKSLPLGLTLSSDTGRISGTPLSSGSFDFTVQAVTSSDYDSKDLVIYVSDKLVITTSDLKDAEISKDYEAQLTTNIGLTTGWTLEGGLLPEGLTLSSNGIISGQPTEEGTFTFTLKASSGDLEAWGDFTLTVLPSFYISTGENLASAEVGKPYSRLLMTNRDTSSTKWYVIGGNFPEGLTLSRDKGLISGTPTIGGVYSFTVQAVSGTNVASKDFTLTIDGSITVVTSQTLPSALEGEEYSQALMADASATWSITAGRLPSGLALSSTGEISGTPSETGEFAFTVLATSGTLTARKDFTLIVVPALSITTETLTSGREGSVYSVTLTAEPYSSLQTSWYKISGDLPAGMALNQSTGTISGTPSEHGTFTFRVAAIRGNFSAYRDYTLTVEAVLQITTPTELPGATSGSQYSYILMTNAAVNDTVTWSAVSSLPAGLSLDASTGEISGTPTVYGTFAFTVRADSGTVFDVKDFSLTVSSSSSLTITTETLPSGKLGTQYSYTLAAGNSSGTLVWQVVSGDFPAGLTLNRSTGTISGTPTLAETFTFMVEVSSGGQSDRKSFTVTISPVLMITTDTLPSAKKDTAYSYTLGVNAASADWSVISGALPEGLSLDVSAGEISGIPTAAGDFTFTIKAASGGLSANKSFTLTVTPVIAITSSSDLPAGKVDTPYVFTLAADAGQSSTVSWSVISGALPQGLTLGASTGVISGTPTTEGTFTFIVQVAEGTLTSQKSFTLAINPVLNILTASPLPNGKINTPYTLTFASDKTPATWSIISGDLPEGIALSSGTISGTPTEEGTFTFTLRAVYETASSDKDFVLTIRPAMSIVTAETLPSGKTGQQYSFTLQTDAAGLVPSWEVISGDFPEGLSMDRMTGTITGTPESEGTYSFSVHAKAGSIVAEKELMLTVEAAMSIVTPSVLPSASVSGNYTFTLTVDGGRPATWYLIGGNLPEGLTLDSVTGVISGYTSAEGRYSFTVQAVSGALTAIKDFTLSVGTQIVIITPTTLDAGSAGSSYSQTFTLDGGISAEWAVVSGDVPMGLSLNARTGTLSGVPTIAGSYTFTLSATSGYSSAIKTFTLNVGLVISTSTLPNGTTGESYSHVLEAIGAAANTLTWSISSDKVIPASSQDVMPYGLTLAPDGVISGTPLQAGSFTFTVYVSGDAGLKADKMIRITIDSPSAVPITTVSLPNGKVSQDYHAELATTETGVTWKHTAGVLPPGITLSESGLISGIPTQAGAFTFTVTATKGSQEGTRQLTITIDPADEAMKPESEDKTAVSSGGGGGGCNTGGMMLFAGILMFLKRKR